MPRLGGFSTKWSTTQSFRINLYYRESELNLLIINTVTTILEMSFMVPCTYRCKILPQYI